MNASLLLLLCAPQAESLLPPLPDGWRSERLELPLSFAPDLPYRGIEDLAFAPGMFEPGSDSWFSYALALSLEGAIVVDEPMLTAFLETYYRGLCFAVAADRGIDGDAAGVRAEVERDGDGWAATIAMFDPFTDGRALELALELDVHATPDATEILGLASPRPADAPIWTELRALGEAWRAARPPATFLNHVYFVVDEETYAALAGSELVREGFAVSEERTTVRADLSYTGLYLYGEHTYFEFLPPTPRAGLAAGASGLALGVEREGGLARLAERLRERGVPSSGGPRSRELDGEDVPWFEILGVGMPAGPLTVFAMEYDARFLERFHADASSAGAPRARASVLARYAAVLDQAERRRTAPFVDVREVRLALDAAQAERVRAVLEAAGYAVETQGEEWLCRGPGVGVRIARAAQPGGLTGLTLDLRAPVERAPLALGRVTLRFQGSRASLDVAR